MNWREKLKLTVEILTALSVVFGAAYFFYMAVVPPAEQPSKLQGLDIADKNRIFVVGLDPLSSKLSGKDNYCAAPYKTARSYFELTKDITSNHCSRMRDVFLTNFEKCSDFIEPLFRDKAKLLSINCEG